MSKRREPGKFALCPKCGRLSPDYHLCKFCGYRLPERPQFLYTHGAAQSSLYEPPSKQVKQVSSLAVEPETPCWHPAIRNAERRQPVIVQPICLDDSADNLTIADSSSSSLIISPQDDVPSRYHLKPSVRNVVLRRRADCYSKPRCSRAAKDRAREALKQQSVHIQESALASNVLQRDKDYEPVTIISDVDDDEYEAEIRHRKKRTSKENYKPQYQPVEILDSSTEEDWTQILPNDKDGDYPERISIPEDKTILYQIKNNGLNLPLKELCLGCDDVDEVEFRHPVFDGGFCKTCMEYWKKHSFACDPNGGSTCCIVCGNGGTLYVCSKKSCSIGFCAGCCRDFLDNERREKIKEEQEWLCFLCTPYDESTHGLLKPNPNWRSIIMGIWQPDGLDLPELTPNGEKRPIRVLSLFDGISTGRVILEKLGVEVSAYYSSEIEPNALMVSYVRYPDIIQLGDVQKITHELLQEIGPVDLLIGGSPCADFALVNHRRGGLESDRGSLFFDFYRVWDELKRLFKDHHLFWLFENTSSMEIKLRERISTFFRCDPAKWDNLIFSAMKRERLFWGNLPTIYSPPKFAQQQIQRIELQDVLMGNNRKAQVNFIPTVTTNPNSTNSCPSPVLYDGKEDILWIPEIERLFGFTDHYTDVGDVKRNERQELLGRSWSVHVVKYLLRPLTKFFRHSDDIVAAPMITIE